MSGREQQERARELLVSVEGVTCVLPGDAARRPVLRGIRWQVRQGCHCALFGPNGAGKSSLLRLVAGELWPSAGRVLWRGDGGRMEDAPLAGRALCALVSPAVQEGWQRRAPEMTGLEALGATLAGARSGMPAREREERARAAAESLGCADLLARRVPGLSQGQLRLLLLAGALAREPGVLLLDECLDGLDAAHRRRFAGALAAYAARGTVIMASHRPDSVPDWCRGRAWLEGGRLLTQAPPSRALSSAPPPPAPSGGAAPAGRSLGAPIFELRGVSVYIDRKKVLHDIDWTLRAGEHWRISGANGSGKSTLLRLLAGDEFAAAGGTLTRRLPSLGRPARTLEETRRGVRLVADLTQALYGYPVTGLELVCSGLDNSIGIYREFSGEERAEAVALMERFFPHGEGARLAATSIRRMSTGELRRLFLARALMGAPDVLLLDEPCSGLDAAARERYLEALERLAVSGGPALVFVSHEAGDAPACCAREARLTAGRLAILA